MTSGQLHPRSITRLHPLALVGIGGAVGSLVRHGVLSAMADPSVAVFVLNIVGSLALGSITGWLQHTAPSRHDNAGETVQPLASLLGLGLCGGLTTFSTHMVDVAQRLDSSSAGSALLSLFGTAAVAVVAAGAGYELTRRMFHAAGGSAL